MHQSELTIPPESRLRAHDILNILAGIEISSPSKLLPGVLYIYNYIDIYLSYCHHDASSPIR
jgi:hypothetical protein